MATDSCDGWTSSGVVARDFVNGRGLLAQQGQWEG